MKHNVKNAMLKFAWLFIAAMVAFTACKKDEEPIPKIDAEDGVYVVGDGTALTDFDPKGLLKITRNEVLQENRTELKELFVPVKAGTDGFNIAVVTGGRAKLYGPGSDFAIVAAGDLDAEEPREGLWKGSYIESSTPFTVPEDALYHVVIDTELEKIAIAKVTWGLIGAASPGGWSDDTPLTATFNLNSMEFMIENVVMKQNQWKFRYSNGWKIILDSDYDLGDGKQGIKVNSNLGGDITTLVPGGDNMDIDNPGKYTIKLNYTLGSPYTAQLTRTGDLDVTDWTNIKFDVFGSGVSATNPTARDDESSWAWGKAVEAGNNGLPVKDGLVYKWSWTNVALDKVDGEGFAVRSIVDGTYNVDVFRYAFLDDMRSDLTIIESTTNDFGDVNFNVVANGNFDLYLVINADDQDKAYLTVVEQGAYFGDFWTIIGDATPNGWNDNQMIPNVDGTSWTWTGDLVEGVFKFRKNRDWAVQIGFNGTDWYFDGNADPYAITSGEGGNYTITLDSVTPNATVTKN